jgi:hypothetical protein
MTNEITQTERTANEEFRLAIHTFQDRRVLMAVDTGAISLNLHMGYGDLVLLGDAIQRIIAGEDGYSETKDDCADIVVGS